MHPYPYKRRRIAPAFAFATILLVGAPALADGPAACIIGEHPGIDDGSAHTAASLVCDAVRNEHVAVGAPTTTPSESATEAYRVELQALGKTTFVVARYESPVGHTERQRRMSLKQLEELEYAAPRIAHALIKNVSVAETQRVDNLTATEGRKHEQLWGDFSWGLGIAGAFLPGSDILVSPSPSLQFWYETEHLGVGTTLRLFLPAGSDSSKDLFGASIDVGGRWLMSTEDFSPFLGGGFAYSGLSVENDVGNGSFDGSGFGAYVEGGLEVLRLHRTHLTIGVRADLPFYALGKRTFDPATGMRGTEHLYVPPISLGVALLF